MHVVVSRKELLRVLSRCQSVADKKSTMPVLGNVLLEAQGEHLRLAATDLFLAVTGKAPARVEAAGLLAVNARDLLERVKSMPEGQLSLVATDGSSLVIRAAGSARRFTLNGIPGDEFPSLPQLDSSTKLLTVKADALATLIAGTHFSISTDETRLHLNSALLEWEDRQVRMVTTDGHRLSKAELQVDEQAQVSMLIPRRGVLELKRLCDEAYADDGDGLVKLAHEGPNVFFQVGGFEFSVKLVDAQFPPYQQVIPEVTEHALRAAKLPFEDALKAVRVAASDRTGGVKLTISANVLRFESESPESGEGFDELPVEYEGPVLTIGLNAQYLLDVLASLKDDEIVLGISGELDPTVIKPANESAAARYLAVVMPMRI